MLRSVSSTVIAPASTGRDRSGNRTVIATDHTNSGIRYCFMFSGFMLNVVDMKFTALKIEDTPAKCTEKTARSHNNNNNYYYYYSNGKY